MSKYFCVSITFLDPVAAFHGSCDGGEPEWPPSPLRMFQAIVAACASHWQGSGFRTHSGAALDWLKQQAPPTILAPKHHVGVPLRLAVPNNDLDGVAMAWAVGREPKKQPNALKTMKTVRPTRLLVQNEEFAAVYYLFNIHADFAYLDTLRTAARSITHLGWGVDMVAGNASIVSEQELAELPGERWLPVEGAAAAMCRVPVEGTLDALSIKHGAFLRRISRDEKGNESFNPVPPLAAFRVVGYRRSTEAVGRPYAVFELRHDDGTRYSHRQEQLIHIAGMVRHVAIEQMKQLPPKNVATDWVERYVAGHRDENAAEHRQFSYLPLPSIGHAHTDPGVRRVMLSAPMGDERLLEHLAKRLAGMRLKPTEDSRIDSPPVLSRIAPDLVTDRYLKETDEWASVTPVILPGHDNHKPAKTRKLIEKALLQSGITQECEFDWSPYSKFPKFLSAHKYDREKRPIGYFRPDHLLNLSAVHLHIRFKHGVKGPLVLGSGRHCGLGLMAGIKER